MDYLLDSYSARSSELDDAEQIRSFLVQTAKVLGMTIVNGPTVHSFRDSGQPEAGLSGFVIIAESHIAIHTWPESGYFQVRISSCKPFEKARVLELVWQTFGVANHFMEKVVSWSGPPIGYTDSF